WLVEVEDDAPGRAGLVVAVARGDRDDEPREIGAVEVALFDRPRQRAEAEPVRRAPAGAAVDPPARADGVAVAGLHVRPRHAPARLSGQRSSSPSGVSPRDG